MRRPGEKPDNKSFFERTFGKEEEKKRLEELNKILEESKIKQNQLKTEVEKSRSSKSNDKNEPESNSPDYFFYENQTEETPVARINENDTSNDDRLIDQSDMQNNESLLSRYSIENLDTLPAPLTINTVNEIYAESNYLQDNLHEGNTSVPLSTKLRQTIIKDLKDVYEKESIKFPNTLHKLVIKLLKTQADLDETYTTPEDLQTVEEKYDLIFNEIASEIENNLGPEFRRGIPIKIGKIGRLRLDPIKRSIHFATNNGKFYAEFKSKGSETKFRMGYKLSENSSLIAKVNDTEENGLSAGLYFHLRF